uniref:Uncharacterized protein n=1 Tax=Tanacetum cinerariifolium TaxID=118510 RepID=A0A6L2JPC8_TANCI|nr:hypothetical protein [Tanacetum cinerariifolium]
MLLGKLTTAINVNVVEDKHVTTTSNDPLLSGEDRLKLTELMELCTQLQSRALALETTKANQALEIRSLKKTVKKLEKRASKKTYKLKRLYMIGFSTRVESSEDASLVDQEDASKQGRMIDDLDADEGVTLEVGTAEVVTTASEVVTNVGVKVSTTAITSQISMDEITLAKALIDIKTSKPKAKGIVMQEPSETPTPTPINSSQQPSKAKDKGKTKMIELEKSLKRKDQIMIDEEVARNLKAQMQAKLEEKERLVRQKGEEDNKALIKSCNNTQAMMNADCELAMLFNNTIKWIESLVPMDIELVKGSEKAAEGSEKAAKGSSKRAARMAYDLLRLIRRHISEDYVPE